MEVPGNLLAMEDNDIFALLCEADGLVSYFHKLIEEVYGEDSLAGQREILREEMRVLSDNPMGAPRSQESPVPDVERLEDLRLKVLLKIRMVLRKALRSPNDRESARRVVLDMADGDLACTTYYHVGGHADCDVILGSANYMDYVKNMRFSPELQRAIIEEGGSISVQDLAGNQHLTAQALELLWRSSQINVKEILRANGHDLLLSGESE